MEVAERQPNASRRRSPTQARLLFSGYPKNHNVGHSRDGSKTIAWENDERVYVPSMVIKDGYLMPFSMQALLRAGKAIPANKCGKGDWEAISVHR